VPKADEALISKISEHLRDLQLGPQLIIANMLRTDLVLRKRRDMHWPFFKERHADGGAVR
jgi:hypothetical protein